LRHDEFWNLTIAEFEELVAGYVWRRDQETELLIYHAWLSAALDRRRKLPSIKQLLNKNAEPKKLSKEERDREWKELQKKFEL
jgi:hypothetical protein